MDVDDKGAKMRLKRGKRRNIVISIIMQREFNIGREGGLNFFRVAASKNESQMHGNRFF